MFETLSAIYAATVIGLGYHRWIRPRRSVDQTTRSLLLLLVVTTTAGFIGAPLWWFDVEQSFAWDLPPLASRMLAAAALSLTAGAVLVLELPTRHRVRLYLILLIAYLAPFAGLAITFHLDRFDFSAFMTYGFFAVVAAITVPSILFFRRQPQVVGEGEPSNQRVALAEKAWFAVCATVTGGWSMALLVTDEGPLGTIWVWPGDLLSSRLIGVMLLALAAGSLYSARSADAVPVMLVVIAVYGAVVPFASAANLLSDKPAKPAYIVPFAVLALGSVVLLVRSSRGHRAVAAPP